MDFSIPAAGLQNASRAFDNSARTFTQAAMQPSQGDSADLSTSAVALLSSKLEFQASVKALEAEDNLTRSALSILG